MKPSGASRDEENGIDIHPEVSHDLAVGDRANSDKHLEELGLCQILRKVVDDQVGARVIDDAPSAWVWRGRRSVLRPGC